MNITQKIIMTIGMISLIVAVWTTPKYIRVEGTEFIADKVENTESLRKHYDIENLLVRVIVFGGVTTGFIVLFQGKKSNKLMETRSRSNPRPYFIV